MKKILLTLLTAYSFLPTVSAQQPYENNGKLDDFSELSSVITLPMEMPDGVKLMTDIYLPVTQDCLMVQIATEPIFGLDPLPIEFIRKGTQLILYDSTYVISNGDTIGTVNPNPYKLPMILQRTPYNKGDGDDPVGSLVSILGYAFSVQDMRGRYASEGVYFPLQSDGWEKNTYHANWQHVLDETDPSDPKNGNRHEDGYHTIQYIVNDFKRDYDYDLDGITDTNDFVVNGRIAMFGGSALGYNQYQAAAARKIDYTQPGLKALLPIVAPNEFFKSTGFQNGVLRDRLVTGWLKGQIFTGTDDDLMDIDNEMHNSIHTSKDYALPKSMYVNNILQNYQENKFDAAALAIDHFVSIRYEDADGNLGPCGYYPNSVGRKDMDASRGMIDALGNCKMDDYENDVFGQTIFSRYENMDVPAYHLTGWWDIFIDGQIETWAFMRKFIKPASGNNKKQKLVIGPWAHQTIGSKTTGDRTYPDNISDLLGFDFDEVSADNTPISKVLKSEVIAWFRYNLNYQNENYLGEPKCVIPESDRWQDVVAGGLIKVRVPSEKYVMTFNELLGLLNGTTGLTNIKAQLMIGSNVQDTTFSFAGFGTPVIPGLDSGAIPNIPYRDFADETDVANVRFYVIGPNDDNMPENAGKGNYWFASDTFPLPESAVERHNFYLHADGTLNETAPVTDEGFNIFVHDPDDPIYGIGGSNMIVRTPDGERTSQGQFNIKDPRYAPYTIDRPGVLEYSSEPVIDSLCIVGFPHVRLYAKTNPGGAAEGDPTDTDFMVRVIDVYPDGREYFVIEGCVNARARDYVRNLVDHPEMDLNWPYPNDRTPFTNIESGKIYEYVFPMPPIAYTFGHGHVMKIVISSSIYTRFQVNPNLPIEDGDFFRRKPGDGRSYRFQGVDMFPRVAVQRVAFAPEYPTHINIPIYTENYTNVDKPTVVKDELTALVFPNPTDDLVNIYMSKAGEYQVDLISLSGNIIASSSSFSDKLAVDVSNLSAGIYFVKVNDLKNNTQITKKLSVK
ncbi:MAG: CocE/NonD family hydrolase [Bacteroidia bacterium]